MIDSWVSLICTLSSTCLDEFGLYVYRKSLCCVLSTTAKRSTEPGLASVRNRAVSSLTSAHVLIHVVAIDCIVDVCGMSNSIGS